jgi:methionine-rich copper-binding protein CopC
MKSAAARRADRPGTTGSTAGGWARRGPVARKHGGVGRGGAPGARGYGGVVRGRARRAALLMVVAFGLLLGTAGGASAHATLLLTDPVNGAALGRMPTAVTLTFSQPQLGIGAAVSVSGPGGVVSEGTPQLVDREVRQAIRPGAPHGTYAVVWRTTSVDGHVISGQFGFTVGAPTGALPAATSAVDTGGIPTVVWGLVGAAVIVVVAGTVLALRRPATHADDEVSAVPVAAGTPQQDRQDTPPG